MIGDKQEKSCTYIVEMVVSTWKKDGAVENEKPWYTYMAAGKNQKTMWLTAGKETKKWYGSRKKNKKTKVRSKPKTNRKPKP